MKYFKFALTVSCIAANQFVGTYFLLPQEHGKESNAGGDEDEGSSGLDPSAAKKLKVDPEKKKEKRQKVDEDEIQKMQ